MQRFTLIVLVLIVSVKLYSQVGIGTTDPHEHAALHIKDPKRGLLIPVANNRNDLPTGSVRAGLLFYVRSEQAFVFLDSTGGVAKWQSANPFDTDINNNEITLDPNYNIVKGNFSGNMSGNFTGNVSGNLDAGGTNTFSGNGTVPVGGIIMWSGTTVPTGWALCDGTTKNGVVTPDLRGRFIVGYDNRSSGYPAHSSSGYHIMKGTGGLKQVKLKDAEVPLRSHTHHITDSTNKDGAHRHVSRHTMEINDKGDGRHVARIGHDKIQGDDTWFVTKEDGVHKHGIDIETAPPTGTFSVTAHENRPPYYVLAFIIRIQ